jgi:DNA-binding MarR family transcriptional regulator
LEADGLVARERDPADRRRHLVTLTAAGQKQLASASRAQMDAEDTMFASLDDTQRAQLRSRLVALSDGLTADPDSACAAAADAGRST